MALNYQSNPEWLAAVAREREIREAAYLGLPTPIADGISLLPLTLRQQMVLFAARNPIVWGGPCGETDAALFLWVCQPDYAPGNLAGRAALFRALDELNPDWRLVVANLRKFYADSSLDDPKPAANGTALPQAPAVCGCAVFTHLFADAYGWTEDYTLDRPKICLNQQRRLLLMKNPKHGITGGRLSNAAERKMVEESRRQREAAAKQTTTDPIPDPSKTAPRPRKKKGGK